MRRLKKFFIFAIVFAIMLNILPLSVMAVAGSWSSSGSLIYYTDGKVEVGNKTTFNGINLEVFGDAKFGRPGGSALSIQSPSSDVRLVTSNSKPLLIPSQVTIGSTTLLDPASVEKLLVNGDATFERAGGSKFTIQTPSSDIRFHTRGTPLVIPEGNVGIGTLTPSHRLSVNGTIRAKELIIDTGWADYVFEEGYNLLSLKEVAQFIKANGHLPNIPSAEVIESGGVSVGEMQKLHMEKIEELTLHLIEKDKQIEDLEQRILRLEKLIVK